MVVAYDMVRRKEAWRRQRAERAVAVTRCPRCMGSILRPQAGEASCLMCGWSGPTRPPTAEERGGAGRRRREPTPGGAS